MRARARLRSGLLRRGLAPAGSVAWFLPPLPRPEPLAAGLAARAARAAAGFACKSATSSVAIPSQVTAIAVGVLNAMKIKKYTVLCSWIMIVGLAAAGSAAWGLQAPASRPPDAGGPAPARVEVVEQAKSAGGEAASILSNGGFETGNDPRDQAPDGWRTGAEVEGVTYGWDRTVAHQGRASLKLSKTAKRYFPIAEWSQRVARSGTRPRLKVGGFVKAENATKAILDVQFLDQQGKWSHAWRPTSERRRAATRR